MYLLSSKRKKVNSASNRHDLPMELIEDQYFASKDENMDKLPNFRKFIALYSQKFILGIGNNLMSLTLTTILIKVINKKLLHEKLLN